MIPAWLSFFDGLLAISLALAGIVSAHYGLGTPLFGFSLLLVGAVFAVIGFVAGLIGVLRTLSPQRRSSMPRAIIGIIFALLVVLPIVGVFLTHRQYPPINDITTDTKNPPEFVNALQIPQNRGRDMKYNPKDAEIQEAAPAYIGLAPLKLDGHPDDVYKRVEIIAGEFPGWKITRNDPQARTIEGVATSKLFQFKDDFIIEVRPGEGGTGSLVEMRSKSRDGKGDLGANYNRIVSFFKAVQGPPRGAPSAAS